MLKKTDHKDKIRNNGTIPKGTVPERQSGYFFTGEDGTTKEIILGRRRGRPPKPKSNPSWYPQDKKVEACTLYAVYGSIDEVSKYTDVPPAVLRTWKNESWWSDITKQVYVESNEGLTAKISKTLDTTLELLNDRLTNGDEILNQRTGELVRKPIDAKVLTNLFHSLAIQRRLGRNEPTSIKSSIATDDRLKQLSEAFEKFSKMKIIEHEELEDAEYSGLSKKLQAGNEDCHIER